jgi:hypothetical protein
MTDMEICEWIEEPITTSLLRGFSPGCRWATAVKKLFLAPVVYEFKHCPYCGGSIKISRETR